MADTLAAGGLPDTLAGWRDYADFLSWHAEEGPAGKSKAYVNLSRGWAISGLDFKSSLLRNQAVACDPRAWDVQGAREVRELRWREALNGALDVLGKTSREIAADAKSAPWKLAVACWFKDNTEAPNLWLSQHLNLGHRACLTSNLTRYRRRIQPNDPLCRRLTRHIAA
ncbi:MAG: hypothetical protein ABI222_07790 [Opitutaceae bacterium]